MDLSFTRSCQNILDVNAQIDNDSGYVSHNQESNSESALDSLNGSLPVTMPSADFKSVYLSEDALLETPEICTEVQIINSSVLSEQCGTPEASCSTSVNIFSALHDSTKSDCSAIIQTVSPIVVNLHDLQNMYCDISSDTNIENNINILNTSTDAKSKHILKDTSNLKRDLCDNYKSVSYLDLSQKSKQLSTTSTINKPIEYAKTPTKTHRSFLDSSFSPDLFSDDERTEHKPEDCPKNKKQVLVEKFILKQDRKLIRRMQNSLCGVLPPPSITTSNFTVEQMLEKIKNGKDFFWKGTDYGSESTVVDTDAGDNSKNHLNFGGSLLVTTSYEKCISKLWPDILHERFHGLHHNRSKYSEELEQLCMKYATRYVGTETHSSCTIFESNMCSPSKRKINKLRWGVKSPGRRLSHLARRRITFSSASIQASSSATSGSNTRQIMMDTRRFDLLSRRRSPKKKSPRKTPRKSPRKSPRKKIRTPSSSAKKRLSLHLKMISDDQNFSTNSSMKLSTTKRALFQSPDFNKPSTSLSKPLFPNTSGNSGLSPFKKRVTPRCALFTSPTKASPSKQNNKRKRLDSEECHPAKLPRNFSLSEDVQQTVKNIPASRLRSDSVLSTSSSYSGELSAHHKKKLQWAVYESLRTQSIGINHPQFKQFASVLAKVTRKFLPNLSTNAPRPEGGTSERMLHIARQYVYAVTKGKSVEEILQEAQKHKLKQQKLKGYVGLGQYISDVSTARNKENVFRDKLNTISSEGKCSLGLNRQDLIKTTLSKSENRVDRVRKIINFDDDPPLGNSSVR